MEINQAVIKKSYLYLKSYAYHENLNLFLKQKVAAFESDDFEKKLEMLTEVINDDDIFNNEKLIGWLDNIDCHLLPKSIVRPEDRKQRSHNKENGLFLSNVTTSEKYEVEKINYFITAPVELHILEVLWCFFVGPVLEVDLNDDCYGNRIHESARRFVKDMGSADKNNSSEIFKRYIGQYSAWRDKALNCASELLENDEDIALLSLDLKSYFYHIDINFNNIEGSIKKYYGNSEFTSIACMLNNIIKEIFSKYNDVISPMLKKTHSDCGDKQGLPIGLACSAILANWYLADFDAEIHNNVRPVYYGRYVDDILLVFKRPKIDDVEPIDCFMKQYLIGIINKSDDGESYHIDVEGSLLPLQKDKLILQYFDKNHSRAGIELFKQELEERSSAFKFLPSEQIDKELDKCAYDVLYDGSSNKLRSIVGLSENETELSRYLSAHITAHRLSKLDNKEIVLPQIKVFFQGVNALAFNRLWEKVYQYALVLNRPKFVVDFYKSVVSEISKIKFIASRGSKISKGIKITSRLKKDLIIYNELSLSISLGLLDISEYKKETIKISLGQTDSLFDIEFEDWPSSKVFTGLQLFSVNEKLDSDIVNFRKSNLIRHHLVAWPLANFTDYEGDLTDENSFMKSTHEIDENKLNLSPRFIHFDEWQVSHLHFAICSQKLIAEWQKDSIQSYKDRVNWSEFPVSFKTEKSSINSGLSLSTLKISDYVKPSTLRVALANLHVEESDIEAAVRKDKKANVSFSRQARLFKILNDAIREKTNLLVMPEVAIPVSWLPFMVSFARRNQIGLVFGLEHWVNNDNANNLLIEALPFKASGKYNSCVMTARLKNHYAPAESEMLDSLRLTAGNIINKNNNYYHKVRWNGVSFATYNCFELSDITHRTIFKSDIDMLIACVWNKDTNYYQHILESAVRDIHCYVVQSNTSQYGGSCVLRPTKTDSKTMLYVKGGLNSSVLTADIDIASLRDFQFKSKAGSKDYFKPLPPGYESDRVLSR